MECIFTSFTALMLELLACQNSPAPTIPKVQFCGPTT